MLLGKKLESERLPVHVFVFVYPFFVYLFVYICFCGSLAKLLNLYHTAYHAYFDINSFKVVKPPYLTL